MFEHAAPPDQEYRRARSIFDRLYDDRADRDDYYRQAYVISLIFYVCVRVCVRVCACVVCVCGDGTPIRFRIRCLDGSVHPKRTNRPNQYKQTKPTEPSYLATHTTGTNTRFKNLPNLTKMHTRTIK